MRNEIKKKGSASRSRVVLMEEKKVKKSIMDFFKINILGLPDHRFVEGTTEISSSGDSIRHYRANLDYLECDIFDTVKVVKFDNEFKNIFFKYYNLSKLRINKVKKLIDSLYLLYGEDDGHKGKFTDDDLKDYHSDNSRELFGRRWIGGKYQYPVAVEIDKLSNVITLSIWGIRSK